MSRSARKMNLAAAGYALLNPQPPSSSLTAQDLSYVATKRILFGHMSVGQNMVDGIVPLYNSYGVAPPNIITKLSNINSASGGFFAEFGVGTNGDPVGKTANFDTQVRLYAAKLDIVFMKFCFIDITSTTDLNAVFTAYKTVMDGITNDFPNITVVYTTSALDIYSTPNAVARAQLAAMVRAEYGATGRVFDLATIESTAPDGSRVGGDSGGQPYYKPYSGYLLDGGHLNATGAALADTKLYELLAGL